MINRSQMARLLNVIESAAHTGHQALLVWGPESQDAMAIEECSELITELMRLDRGRSTDHDVTEEAADVIITALQVGLAHCDGTIGTYNPDALIDAIARKTQRLETRIKEARQKLAAELEGIHT